MNRLLHRLASTTRTVLAACILALGVLALEKVEFNPFEHLEGFGDVTKSEFKALYELEPFYDLAQRAMEDAELAATRARWAQEVARVRPAVAKLEANPIEYSRFLLRPKLATHAVLQKRAFDEDATHPGWLFLTERPSANKPNLTGRRVQELAPWLARLGLNFEEEYAKPLGLVRRRNYGEYAVIVLETAEDFAQYVQGSELLYRIGEVAAYDPRLRAIVTFHDVRDRSSTEAERAYPVMKIAVQAMLHAHFAGDGEIVPQAWLFYGFGDYLAWPSGATPTTLDKHEGRPEIVDVIAALAQDRDERKVSLVPLLDLVEISSFDEVFVRARRRGEAIGRKEIDLFQAFAAFLTEARVWVQFLHEGADGSHRAAFDAYLKSALGGDGAARAMSRALGALEPATIEKAFWLWVFERFEARHPETKLDRGLIDELEQNARRDRAVAAAASFQPRALLPLPEESDAWRGLAVACARRGELERALATLAESAKSAPAGTPGDAVRRELARMSGVSALRRALLEALAARAQRVSFAKDGKEYKNLMIKAVEGTRLVFDAANKQGIAELDLATSSVSTLARLCDPKLVAAAPAWARAYVLLLAGDARWERAIKDASVEARELSSESNDGYEELARAGAVAEALTVLAELGVPKTSADARRVREQIEALGKAREVPLVARRREGLATLARIALEIEARELAPTALLAVGSTPLEGGRVRLAYDFSDAAQAADFELVPGRTESFEKQLPLAHSLAPSFAVREGAAHVTGSGFWKLALPVDAPLRVEFSLEAVLRTEGKTQRSFAFYLHVLDDLRVQQAEVSVTGAVGYRSANGQGKPAGTGPYPWDGERRTVELLYDGKVLRALVDGEESEAVGVEGLAAGALGFFVHTDHLLHLDDLVIEFRPAAGGADELRAAWVERQAGALGF